MNTSLSSAELLDVSFAGSTITVAGRTISQFMDDANPVEFPDMEVTNIGMNFNGKMIRNAKAAACMMSLTVIPSSPDDVFLHGLLMKYHVQDGKNNAAQWETSLTASISVGGNRAKKTWSFSGGTFVSGPGGPSASGDGKMQGRTYTFAFAKITS